LLVQLQLCKTSAGVLENLLICACVVNVVVAKGHLVFCQHHVAVFDGVVDWLTILMLEVIVFVFFFSFFSDDYFMLVKLLIYASLLFVVELHARFFT